MRFFLEGKTRQTECIMGVSKTKNRDSSDRNWLRSCPHVSSYLRKQIFFCFPVSLSFRHRKRTFSKMVPRMDIFVIWTNFVARRTKTEVFEYFDGVKFYQSEKGWSLTTYLSPSHRPPRAFDIFFPLLSLPTTYTTKEASAEERVNQWQTEATTT